VSLCACHGLPQAPNNQCVVKRRAAQARYGRSKKGKDTGHRYQRTEKGKATHARYWSTPKGWATQRRNELKAARRNALERLEELQAEKEEIIESRS